MCEHACVYYSLESDNFYCYNCHRGMGNDYYLDHILSEKLHHQCNKKISEKRAEICELFIDPDLDLNKHRELIEHIALYAVNQSDDYENKLKNNGRIMKK